MPYAPFDTTPKNTQKLAGIRCPKCYETQGFVVQLTINVVMNDDGFDCMSGQFPDDYFPGRNIDEDDGLSDEAPIVCANRNGCQHRGTVAEFRESNQI
jgi:hypothetical protein